MKVLVACEFSGIVRDAFAARGHDAWSCDLLPSERNGKHIQGDVLACLSSEWDLMIAHPPCTHLASSGARWFKDKKGLQASAIVFVIALSEAPIPKIAIENPVGVLSTQWRKPDQIIQPFYFGDEAQKTTCLWLKNLPTLIHTEEADWFYPKTHVGRGEMVTFSSGRVMPRWYAEARGNAPLRSKTFIGIADAMANQWG